MCVIKKGDIKVNLENMVPACSWHIAFTTILYTKEVEVAKIGLIFPQVVQTLKTGIFRMY